MLDNFTKVNLETRIRLNNNVIANFLKLKPTYFLLPLVLLLSIVGFLFYNSALSVEKYVQIQKNCFLYINSELSQYPTLIYNLTQIGDALIFLSFLTLLIIYAPKVWEALLTASIVSALFSRGLKDLFLVPRPAEVFDNNIFVIVGRRLPGFSSLPSGHSITTFTIITVLLFAFMPKKVSHKIIWILLLVCFGLIIVSTRVGVGAHHPLDVITGSIIGFLCGLIGIFISRKYRIWNWITIKKYYPVFITLFVVCGVVLVTKISKENLLIYYFSLISLIFSLYKIIYVYVKK
jgi:membrane-associated phospholipid phosphatase